ncbi:MAG: tyrosine-type recombinase/integrase [Pyrinomonadaceae bacterium]
MGIEAGPKLIELKASSVSERTKWNRKAGKKLAKKLYVARLFYIDETGSKRERSKEFQKRKDADDYVRQQRQKFERSGGAEIVAENMTFNDLADHYLDHYAKKVEYAEGRKIAGLRSLAPVLGYIETLRTRFGKRKLKSLTYGDIRDFRSERLKAPVIKNVKLFVPLTPEERKALATRKKNRIEYVERSSPRKIASVNRELMTLRRMLNIAVTEGWIPRSPLTAGPSLINMADETMRTRVLTPDEEVRLLEVCDCDERRHLRSIVVCLLDTGLRFSEAITLTWDNVDLAEDLIQISAFNSKTAKPKTVPISSRLRKELERLWIEQRTLIDARSDRSSHRVFGIESNVNRSWRTARRLAGLEGVRIHDLRHTFGTRLDRSGFTQAQIARMLGHQQVHTTFRYTNPDHDLLRDVRAAVESFNDTTESEMQPEVVH